MASFASDSRYVDMRIRVILADVEKDDEGRAQWKAGTDEVLTTVGGRWDRKKKRWSDHLAAECLDLRFHRGQEPAIRWLVDWLQRFTSNNWKGTKRAWSAMLIGGRRSGKTHVCCALMVIFGVLYARARLWALSPTLETGDELQENFKAMLPKGWYQFEPAGAGRAAVFVFANRTRLLLRSAIKPARLKAGRVDIALLNEAQELEEAAYIKIRAAVADRGGIVLIAANPPDSKKGRWVERHYVKAKKAEIAAVVFQLDPRNNPFIAYEALASMADEADEKTYQRDVLGLFPPIGDVVFHAWDDFENWRDPAPEFVDITAELVGSKLQVFVPDIVGEDFQKMPAMVGIVLRVYRDPADPSATPMLWVVDEAIPAESDEDGLCDALEAMPRYQIGDGAPDTRKREEHYSGEKAAVVMDASGFYQDGAHTKGRTSELQLRARRWTKLFRPQPPLPDGKPVLDNPEIRERMKLGNALLKASSGRRRLFVAKHCKRTAEALREYENNQFGEPDRRSKHAHVVDGVTYPAYRLFGRPRVAKAKLEYRSVLPRDDRRSMFDLS